MTDNPIREGFTPHKRKSPVTQPWEPLYAKLGPDRLVLATHIRGGAL